MRIIISPAKKMNCDTDSFPYAELPPLLPKTEQLIAQLRDMSYEDLKTLWHCNDQIATLNFERLQTINLHQQLTPAILSYDGIQYRYMSPGVFTDEEFVYVNEHLRILSGFYGILRPFDGVTPYRLEMQAKLAVDNSRNLYEFWGDMIAKYLFAETNTIINLASKEYSRCISDYLPENYTFLTCIFGQLKDGKVIEKGTQCKIARGEMVRYMAEEQIEDIKALQGFNRLGYLFSPEQSDESTYVYLNNVV